MHQQHLIKGTRDKESKKGTIKQDTTKYHVPAMKEQLTTAQKQKKKIEKI